MSKHTPEPWVTGRDDMQSYYGHNGEPFSSVYRLDDDPRMPMTPDGFGGMVRVPLRIAYVEGRDLPREEEKANARRIVACVNACAGMDDPAAEIERLRARVEELESAAKELADGWTNKHVVNTDLDRRVVNMILAWDRPRYEAKMAELHRAANERGEQ